MPNDAPLRGHELGRQRVVDGVFAALDTRRLHGHDSGRMRHLEVAVVAPNSLSSVDEVVTVLLEHVQLRLGRVEHGGGVLGLLVGDHQAVVDMRV